MALNSSSRLRQWTAPAWPVGPRGDEEGRRAAVGASCPPRFRAGDLRPKQRLVGVRSVCRQIWRGRPPADVVPLQVPSMGVAATVRHPTP